MGGAGYSPKSFRYDMIRDTICQNPTSVATFAVVLLSTRHVEHNVSMNVLHLSVSLLVVRLARDLCTLSGVSDGAGLIPDVKECV
jgi:hypothetical protein